MANLASFFSSCSSSSPLRSPCLTPSLRCHIYLPSVSLFSTLDSNRNSVKFRCLRTRIYASSSSSPAWEFSAGDEIPLSKKSSLFNLVQDIEPMDVSLIQKDVPLTAIDAMKRTISGMLGLLPSDQFQVMTEALWEPLFKLLISSIMTGFTLRNAEYRLSLERNFDTCEENADKSKTEDSKHEARGTSFNETRMSGNSGQDSLRTPEETREVTYDIPDFGEMTPEARQYILKLHSRLSSVKKELHEVKRKSAALQMQQFVGEEKNDLLDYLRSLEPEKVLNSSPNLTPPKIHFKSNQGTNPIHERRKNLETSAPSMSEIMDSSRAQNLDLQLQTFGPFFRITAKSLKTQMELGRAEGVIRFWFGGKILHLDSIRLQRETLGMEKSIFGIGLFIGAVAIRHGYESGCKRAELLAINDTDLYHSKLVRFYTRIGFRTVYEVTGSSVGDLSHMLVWGGVGTRMDANVEELMIKWCSRFKTKTRIELPS